MKCAEVKVKDDQKTTSHSCMINITKPCWTPYHWRSKNENPWSKERAPMDIHGIYQRFYLPILRANRPRFHVLFRIGFLLSINSLVVLFLRVTNYLELVTLNYEVLRHILGIFEHCFKGFTPSWDFEF